VAVGGLAWVASLRPNPQGRDGMLNLCQTDEWKGVMQLCLLYYHYLVPSPQPLFSYILARIIVAAFLFQTGYGRTMSALAKTSNFNARAILTIILRLNLLTLVLAMATNRSWNDYYFTPLVTFWTIVFYLLHTVGVWLCPRTRVVVVGVLCVLLSMNARRDPEQFSFAALFFSPLKPILTSKSTPFDTWLFRSQLDCFSPLMGAVVALNHEKISYALARSEGIPAWRKGLFYALVCTGAVGAMAMWAWPLQFVWTDSGDAAATCLKSCSTCKTCKQCGGSGPSLQFLGPLSASRDASLLQCVQRRIAQEQYNYQHHAFLCVVPCLAYISLRNLTPYCRSHSSPIMGFIGARSLELYLLQYHLWLSNGAFDRICVEW